MKFEELEHGKLVYSKSVASIYRVTGVVVGTEGERTVQATLFAGEGKEEITISETDPQWDNLDYIQEEVSKDPIAFASMVAMTLRMGTTEQRVGQLFSILEQAGMIKLQRQGNGLILPRGGK